MAWLPISSLIHYRLPGHVGGSVASSSQAHPERRVGVSLLLVGAAWIEYCRFSPTLLEARCQTYTFSIIRLSRVS